MAFLLGPAEYARAEADGEPATSSGDDTATSITEPTTEMTPDMDEMVVLAGGRDDFDKNISISSTSFGAAEIKSLRIQNISDIADYTPNLEINTAFAASNPTLFIRGIGLKDYNANAAGAVSVYQDGINMNSPAIQLGQIFDVEGIEVLRGPQGSGSGRNATAGAIRINSVLPDGEFDATATFSYGNFNLIESEGAIALPIIKDLLSARASFTANFRDGITKNNCANWDPESIGKPRLTEQTIRAAWEFNGSPTNKRRFPKRGETNRLTDEKGRELLPDKVCIYEDPGHLEFPDPLADAVWVPNDNQTARTIADFQGLKRKVNNVDNWAARVIFRLQPDLNDGMDWVLNAHGGQNLGDSRRQQSLRVRFLPQAGALAESVGQRSSEVLAGLNSGLEGTREINGFFSSTSSAGDLMPGGRGGDDIDAGFYDRDGLELLDMWGVSLNGTWDTGPVLLTLIAGYEWYERSIEDEGDAVPTFETPALYDDTAWQTTAELRAEGEGEQYSWLVGGFFLYEELLAGNIFPGIRNRRVEQQFDQVLTSAAPYISGEYWLGEFSVSAGLRYNYEHKDFTLTSEVQTLSGNSNVSIPAEMKEETWKSFTGDFTLAWKPESDWMYDARLDQLTTYLKYGRGTKGGHFNAGLTILPMGGEQQIDPVEPEFIHSIELGFNSIWLQNRLSAKFAIFHYWYTDLQVFDFDNEVGQLPLQKLLNADALVLGAELEVQIRPVSGLLVQLAAGWLDSEFLEFTVSKTVFGGPRGSGTVQEFDYRGNPLISAPSWSASGIIEYQIPLFGWGSLVPQYDFSYRSKVFLDPQAIDPISQIGFFIHNARLAYRTPDGRFELAAWVENFIDQRYKIDAFDVSLDSGTVLEVWNDPRSFGMTVSFYY